MIGNIRRLVLRALTPVARAMASSDADLMSSYDRLSRIMRPGDVLVTMTKWRITNPLIPGRYNHAAFYVGDDRAVHALGRIELIALPALLAHVDDFALLRPLSFTVTEIERACKIARGYVGLGYDYSFEPGVDALYCSELVAAVLHDAREGWGFEWRERLGVLTVLPQDIHDASKYFGLITNRSRILDQRKEP